MPKLSSLYLSGSLALAGASGALGAVALTNNSKQQPVTTTTINVATGQTGPAGATGPAGPAGTESCPTGSKFGELVINHPGGQVTILTCIVG